MNELITKFEATCGKKIKETYNFPANGTFKAFYEAQKLVKAFGYTTGSMCRDEPIGIANAESVDYISKWRNLSSEEKTQLDGGLLSKDFREGDVLVVIFE